MATAHHKWSAYMANITGSTNSDASNMVSLRALLRATPRRISLDDIQPPAILPMSEMAYTATKGGPKFLRSKPYRLAKKSGSQNRNIHHIGSIRNLAAA